MTNQEEDYFKFFWLFRMSELYLFCSTYELTKQFINLAQPISKRITCTSFVCSFLVVFLSQIFLLIKNFMKIQDSNILIDQKFCDNSGFVISGLVLWEQDKSPSFLLNYLQKIKYYSTMKVYRYTVSSCMY